MESTAERKITLEDLINIALDDRDEEKFMLLAEFLVQAEMWMGAEQ